MAGEVVEDDDVAWAQLGDQHLLDVGNEGIAVHGLVEDAGRDHPTQRQPSDHRRGVPVAMRHADLHPLIAGAGPWVRAMFVLAHVSSRNTRRTGSRCPGTGPRLPALVLVREVPLARMTGLLLARHPVTDQEPVQRAGPETQAPPGQRPAQYLDCQIGLVGQHLEDLRAMLFDPARATVTTQRLGDRGCRARRRHRLTLPALTLNRSATAR